MLDIGTTTIKAFVFDENLQVLAQAKAKPSKSKPQAEYVEQDPLEIIRLAKQVLKEAVQTAKVKPANIASFGITNQRETIVAWDSTNGQPLYPAIVWEDTRTSALCDSLKKFTTEVQDKTGLPIDPYFSATKINWLLQQPAVDSALKNNNLLVGTVDTWALWNLSAEHTHATDYTNASRTLLFNTKTLRWDDQLLKLFAVPAQILPTVLSSTSDFGSLDEQILGAAVPIRALCGDQQASQYAAGVSVGATKVTFGTGIFISQSIGGTFQIKPPFFTTLIPNDKQPWYAVETKINDSGKRFQALLDAHADYNPMLKEFSMEINKFILKLPYKPAELIIDGGIIKDTDLPNILSQATGIPVRAQTIPDGTPLGVAKLLLN